MCNQGRRPGPAGHGDCGCGCPVAMTVEEEIHLLGEHRKYLQERLAEIDRKIAALASAQGS